MPTTKRGRNHLPAAIDQKNIQFSDLWCKHGFLNTDGEKEIAQPPKRSKIAPKLPTKLIAFPNADKKWHEKWETPEGQPPRDLLNFPHPVRAILTGPPKSQTLIVIIIIIFFFLARPHSTRTHTHTHTHTHTLVAGVKRPP